jgi:hypothetical protein
MITGRQTQPSAIGRPIGAAEAAALLPFKRETVEKR